MRKWWSILMKIVLLMKMVTFNIEHISSKRRTPWRCPSPLSNLPAMCPTSTHLLRIFWGCKHNPTWWQQGWHIEHLLMMEAVVTARKAQELTNVIRTPTHLLRMEAQHHLMTTRMAHQHLLMMEAIATARKAQELTKVIKKNSVSFPLHNRYNLCSR